ncbi:MAG: hypothetical protein NVSMB1_18480 [Polyangiales bacterium]
MVLIALGSVLAVRRARDFADDRKFWWHELARNPDGLDALRFAIESAERDRHFEAAMQLTAAAKLSASRSFAHTGLEADFVEQATLLILQRTKDRDHAALETLERFDQALLDAKEDTAVLSLRDLRMSLALRRGPIAVRLAALRPRILIDRADIESRLGHDEAALQWVEQALQDCPRCVDIGRVSAMVEARAHHYERAFAILDEVAHDAGEASVADVRITLKQAFLAFRQGQEAEEGPVKIQLRATEFAKLQAWGRAYEVLAPHREAIEQAPGFAIGFAELAWRAGETEVARGVLTKVVPKEKVDDMLHEWSRKRGWREAEARIEKPRGP